MTTIKKLSISGIRSYDPNTPVTIEFQRPLTLFTGNNGSGKTTIIEALRFACTGINPPDSLKGKSFVHDPLLSKECLVRAQIKLTLKTFDGKPVTIIRSFQVSQKAKTRRYQQIDATIRSINEEGERVTATHKCLEIDNIAARIMKVSKAILSNVIFCHQEESLWPMGDSKSLKLKFDDIFSSTKYTKALQKIKTVRKNLKTKTAFLEKDLLLAKNNLQSYKKYKNDLENLTKEIVILNETSSKLSKDINVEENNLERLEENVESVKETQNEIERLNFRISALLKEKKILELSIIEILDKSDEDIKNDLDICLKQSKVLVAKLEKSENAFKSAQNKLHLLKDDYENNIQNIGKMNAEEERNDLNKERIFKMTESLAKQYDILVPAGTEIFQAEHLLQKLCSFSISKHTKLKSFVDEFLMNEEKLRKNLEKYQQNLATENQILKQLKTEIKSTDNKLNAIQIRLNKNRDKQKMSSAAKNQISDIQNKLKSTLKLIENANFEQIASEFKTDIKKLEKKLKNLEIDLDLHRLQSSKSEIVNEKIKTLNEKKKAFQNRLKTSIELLSDFNDIKIDEKSADFSQIYFDLITKKNNENESKRDELEKTIIGQKSEFGNLSGKISITNSEIKKLQKTKSKNKKLIFKKDKIDFQLKENRKELQELNSKISFEKAAICIYKRIVKKLSDNKICPICDRKLFPKDVERVLNKINEKIGSFEDNENSQNFKKIEEIKVEIEKLEKLVPINKELKECERSLNEKQSEYEKFRINLKNCQKELVKNEKDFKKIKNEQTKILNAANDAKEISTLFSEIGKLSDQIEKEKFGLKTNVLNGKSVNYDQIKKDHQFFRNLMKEKESKLAKTRERKEKLFETKNEQIMSLSKLRKNESEYQNLVNEEKRFLNEIKTNKQNLKALKTKIGKMDIIDVEKSINEIQKEMRENSLNFKMKKDEKEEEIKKLEKEKTEFESVLKHLKLYSSLEIERKQIKRLFEKNKKKKSSLEQVLKTEEKSILEIRENLKEKEQKVKNFEQNAKFRETEKEYLKIVKERNDLKSKVERSFGENELFSKYEEAKKKIGDLKKMFFESDGRKSAFKDQAIEISNTIKNNESFEMIEDHFKDTLINLETNLVANKDLDLYQKALDNALIEFHSIKMKEINAILKKYWKLVYKGNDIDFIEIVSNCDENTVQRTSNRNYNYFVLMVCGDAKLEMKGRCSAGQKVLASLLIRLSLAETFCKNCNILALDEPTSNLDEENSKSFGESLNELIKNKRDFDDFQLLLITHNEKFAEQLGRKNDLESFYRIGKDKNGHSKISKIDWK